MLQVIQNEYRFNIKFILLDFLTENEFVFTQISANDKKKIYKVLTVFRSAFYATYIGELDYRLFNNCPKQVVLSQVFIYREH